MTIQILAHPYNKNGKPIGSAYDITGLLSSPPAITDQLNAVCRVLELSIKAGADMKDLLGYNVDLWYNGKRWYHGRVNKSGVDSLGNRIYTAYDPLYYFKQHTNDFYYKNVTATQALYRICGSVRVASTKFANTGVVFPALYYTKADAYSVVLDMLARTQKASGKKFWVRYDAEVLGLRLFERKDPAEVWAFLAGVNLTDAIREASLEDIYNLVQLVDRETGKIVARQNALSVESFGVRAYMEEIDKDATKTMEKDAQKLADKLSKVSVTMDIRGVNPNKTMGQLYSGDLIYVEEKTTKILGAYHIKDLKQIFVNDNLIEIEASVQRALDVPPILYDDATDVPDWLTNKK